MELVVAAFDGPLWETVRLVRGTDVFLGMHGAGFTNVLWLRQVCTHFCAHSQGHSEKEETPMCFGRGMFARPLNAAMSCQHRHSS